MRGAGIAAVLLLALTAHAAFQPADAPAGDPVGHALAYLATRPATPEAVEAFVAAGHDPAPLVAALAVPSPDPADPNAGLRHLHALLRAGVRLHDDPVRGPVDLVAQLRASHEAAVRSGAASSLGFWLLSAHALGWDDDPAVADAIVALAAIQQSDGSFPCLAGYRSLDCTGFAVAALAAHDALRRIDRDAVHASILAHGDGGAYTDGFTGRNAQSTAWAATALRHLGDDDGARAAQAWLLGLQRPDGSFARAPGQPGPMPWWTTAEVVVALSGGHPVPALDPHSGRDA